MGGASLEREGGVGVITVDNPPVNAMSPGLPGAILARLAEAQADDAVDAVVLRGAPARARSPAPTSAPSARRGPRASRRCAT